MTPATARESGQRGRVRVGVLRRCGAGAPRRTERSAARHDAAIRRAPPGAQRRAMPCEPGLANAIETEALAKRMGLPLIAKFRAAYEPVGGGEAAPAATSRRAHRRKTLREPILSAPAPGTGVGAQHHAGAVRSGQQVYARERDLIVTGAIANGAEVIADGNIHIYGGLRGRAMAGAQGDEKARIFVSDFRAELVAIAGQYRKHCGDEPLTAEIIVVTSGKGGVGKTTTSASLATGLAMAGKKVAVIDFDVGLRNLDLIMGCERRVVYDFVNVVHGEATLKQSLIKDKRHDNLYVLAASQTRDKDALTQEGVEKVLDGLSEDGFDYVVCDSPAGIEKGAHLAMYFADHAVVVVNPEVSSTRRAERGEKPITQHLLLTRYNPARVAIGEMLSVKDVEEILGINVVGVIPESENVLTASNNGIPVIVDTNSLAGQAYSDTVARILGEERPLRFIDVPKKGFLQRVFGG
ncbi:MAG: hypothetical protein WDW38_006608 [Sanguina aurantia]